LDSHYFMMLNANKRSITLDVKSARGKSILRDLILQADVFIENFAPGAIERLGFSYEEVSGNMREAVFRRKFTEVLDRFIKTARSRSEIEVRENVLAGLQLSGSQEEVEGAHGGGHGGQQR